MSTFYDVYSEYKDIDLDGLFKNSSSDSVERAICTDRPSIQNFLTLISPAAQNHLEEMAQKAHRITVKNFGRTIQLYTPMYLSNYCDNRCVYCGFNSGSAVPRRKLSIEEVIREASYIASTGLKHILILSGESKSESPVSYIKKCVNAIKGLFDSISIEIYPLTEAEYAGLIEDGVDGLTIYQETYDEKLYDRLHISGPKKDYINRLNAPERGALSGMRSITIGALLGLGPWRGEAFFTALHASYLEDKFPGVDIGIAVPRLRPHAADKAEQNIPQDKDVVQLVTALRIFLPRISITLSTREDPIFRENFIPLGVTRISAGSTTRVGGHTIGKDQGAFTGQFEIQDERNVEEVKLMVEKSGYLPVFKDWTRI